MEKFFVSITLIYSLASCSLLLAALFRFRSRPRRYLLVGFWTVCAHIIYKVVWAGFAGGGYELPIPFGLAYPVLLYLFARAYYAPTKTCSRRFLAIQSAPLVFHLLLYVGACLQPAGSGWTVAYATVYYVCCMVSLLVYAVLTTRLFHRVKASSNATDVLIRQLTILCFGLVVLSYLVFHETRVPESGLGFEVRPAVYLFLAIGFALLVRHATEHGDGVFGVRDESGHAVSPLRDERHRKQTVGRTAVEPELIATVERVLIDTKLFLNPSVSLDMLAAQTSIPRHQLTQIFSMHYGKSFYQFIAGMRIEYAIKEITKLEETVTLDSLSYACGFNSKTSFNRYFKAYTGMTPSEYRTAHQSLTNKALQSS